MTGRAPLQFEGLDLPLLRYGKTRNKERVTYFATLLENELNSASYHPQKQILQPYFLLDRLKHVDTNDVACFTNHILVCPVTNKVARFISAGDKTRNIKIRFPAMLQNKLDVFCCSFYCTGSHESVLTCVLKKDLIRTSRAHASSVFSKLAVL